VKGFGCRPPGEHRTFLNGTGSSVPDPVLTYAGARYEPAFGRVPIISHSARSACSP
jgi:hypothetical protein